MIVPSSPKVSILVPCYNVQDYVEQCLESLRTQTLEEIEVIMINDGSTDGTLEILKSYQQLDQRFKLINKPNSGYGDSMNMGLSEACGKYIGILESDDFADREMYAYLYEMCEIHNLDFCRSEFYWHRDGTDVKNSSGYSRIGQVIFPREDPNVFLLNPSVWSCLYNRKWMQEKKIKFLSTPGASFQDISFAFKASACANRFMMTDRAFVHYRLFREGNSMGSRGKEFCVCTEIKEVFSFVTSQTLHTACLLECATLYRNRFYRYNVRRFSARTLPDFINFWASENIELKQKELYKPRYLKMRDKRIEWLVSNFPKLATAYYRIKYKDK